MKVAFGSDLSNFDKFVCIIFEIVAKMPEFGVVIWGFRILKIVCEADSVLKFVPGPV